MKAYQEQYVIDLLERICSAMEAAPAVLPTHVEGQECGTCGAWCASIDVAIGACRARSPVVVNGGNRWPLTACGEACCEWRPRAEVKS